MFIKILNFQNPIHLKKNKLLMLQFSDNSFKPQTQGPAIKVLIKLIQLGYSTGYSRNIGTNFLKKY